MSEQKTSKVSLKVAGMSCASCVAHIEGALKDLKGVSKAQVNLAAQKAYVEYDPAQVDLGSISRAVHDVGYEVVPDELVLQIPGMRSAHCEGVVRQGVTNLPGVVRVEANANTIIVSGLTSSQDAEHYAGLCGTKTTQKETRQVEKGFFGHNDTGMKSVRDVEEYVVHPNELKGLRQGEFFVHSKVVDPNWGLVRVDRAEEFLLENEDSSDVSTQLKQTRASYLQESLVQYLDLGKFVPAKPSKAGEHGPEESWD
jgi:copper ion binding protein